MIPDLGEQRNEALRQMAAAGADGDDPWRSNRALRRDIREWLGTAKAGADRKSVV